MENYKCEFGFTTVIEAESQEEASKKFHEYVCKRLSEGIVLKVNKVDFE